MGGKPRQPRAFARGGDASIRATVTVTAATTDGPLYVDVPPAFARAVGTASRVAVTGSLNSARFDGAAIPLGGRLRVVVNRALAARAGVYRGSIARLQLSRIPEPR